MADLAAVKAMATAAGADDRSPDGPGSVGPTYSGDASSLVTLPMSADEIQDWWQRVADSDARIQLLSQDWDILLREYLPVVKASGAAEDAKVNAHFRNIHTKIGQLFFRSPELQLTPKGVLLDPQQVLGPNGMPQTITAEDVVSVKQAVLNMKLGRDGIKANRLMDQLLFDVLAWAGIGCCKVGYCATMKTIQQPVMVPDPNFVAPQPQSPLGLSPQPQPQMVPQTDETGQPVMQDVQVPVHEEYYGKRFSPKKAITNIDLDSTRTDDDATLVGMHFYLAPRDAMKRFGLTEDQVKLATKDDKVFDHVGREGSKDRRRSLVHGVELWVKAAQFTEEVHPEAVNQLVLIEGLLDRPVVWRPSPDQEFDPSTGRLTEDSLIGFPIKILTLRDLADSAFPPSDSAFTNVQVKGLNTHRQQSIRLRDAAIGKTLLDAGAFEEGDVDKIKNGTAADVILVQEGKLQARGAEGVMALTAQVHATPDDYRTAAILKQDMDETLGIGSNQAGIPESTVRSATEIAAVQTAVAGRAEKEQSRALDFYLDIARALDSLLMRYATADDYIHIDGQDGARRLMMWNNKLISGKYMYEIAPDSQLRVDTAHDRQQFMNYYNLTAKDPLANRVYNLRSLARKFGQDPSKAVLSPQQAMMMQAQGLQHGGEANKHESAKSGGPENAPGAVNHRTEQSNLHP